METITSQVGYKSKIGLSVNGTNSHNSIWQFLRDRKSKSLTQFLLCVRHQNLILFP